MVNSRMLEGQVPMNKIIALLAGTAISGVDASVALLGVGVAVAGPDVVGEPYSGAVDAIEEDGGTAKVAARVGDKLDQDDCVVTTVQDASFLRIDTTDEDEVMLSLNCAGQYATAINPRRDVDAGPIAAT